MIDKIKYNSYPKYKPSGIDWFGDLPEHWEAIPLKRIVAIPVTDGPHETPEILEEGIPFVSAEAIRDNRIDFEKKRGFISIEDHRRYSQKCKPKRDDIFMIKSGATTGNLAIVETDEEFNIWSPLAVIRANMESALPKYILFAMNSKEFQTSVQLSWSYGTQQNIGMNVIENLPIPVPPLAEQQVIAGFLDVVTERIDTLVAKKKRLVELLKEKRTVLISHAVTRGISELIQPGDKEFAKWKKPVKLKPSGIQWFADIPKHWEIKRLKYVSPHITVGIVVEPSKYYIDEGISCLRSLNVKPHRLVDSDLVFISPESNKLHAKSQIFGGDLVAVRSGQPGTTAVVDKRFHGTNCIDLIIIRKPFAATSVYLDYFLNSDLAKTQFEAGTDGAIQHHFNITTAMSLQIILPPLPEQQAITAFLDRETGKIDGLISKVKEAMEKLTEYRMTIISAAVTGKINVLQDN